MYCARVGALHHLELFTLLRADGYEGNLASEIELKTENPTPEQYLAMYGALFRAWANQPFYPMRRGS